MEGLKYSLAARDRRAGCGPELFRQVPCVQQPCSHFILVSLDIPFDVIQRGLKNLESVPGRFDVIRSGTGISVVVDYAHTGDALQKTAVNQ
jgi:folylpolyglutamate synthase/dihydropteroate synthase